jgi:hypothetical protein
MEAMLCTQSQIEQRLDLSINVPQYNWSRHSVCTTSVSRYCQVVQQTWSSKGCALVTTKSCTGVNRLDNIMTVQMYNWFEQSFWSTSLNYVLCMNGTNKVCALVTTKSKVHTDPIGVENWLWPLRSPQRNLEFFMLMRYIITHI